jgi:hypothetical protein
MGVVEVVVRMRASITMVHVMEMELGYLAGSTKSGYYVLHEHFQDQLILKFQW